MTIESGMHEDKSAGSKSPRRQPGNPFWFVATVLALAANVVLFAIIHQLGASVARQKDDSAAQIAKLNNLIAQNDAASSQRLESVAREAHDSAAASEEQAKAELRRTNANLAARIARETKAQQQQRSRRSNRWRANWMS